MRQKYMYKFKVFNLQKYVGKQSCECCVRATKQVTLQIQKVSYEATCSIVLISRESTTAIATDIFSGLLKRPCSRDHNY